MEDNTYFNLSSSSSNTDSKLQDVMARLSNNLERDYLVQQLLNTLRSQLAVDRLVLYYFYYPWKGQVTFEALSDERFSIFGSMGPDDCFNADYAELYRLGRYRAIADIETEPIQPCHRDFLRSLQVRANLVVPVLTQQGLWGLLVAHSCQSARVWTDADIQAMQENAVILATAPSIRGGI